MGNAIVSDYSTGITYQETDWAFDSTDVCSSLSLFPLMPLLILSSITLSVDHLFRDTPHPFIQLPLLLHTLRDAILDILFNILFSNIMQYLGNLFFCPILFEIVQTPIKRSELCLHDQARDDGLGIIV